jgi:hypothetical protein
VNGLERLARPPADLELWLLLGYAVTVLAAARMTEVLAQMHFRRARRIAEFGFHYDADGDHYHCPQGERLSLHLVDSDQRVAVYRAPASTCVACPSKSSCTPHDAGRHIYRPLAEWAETDVGRFHQWLSLFMAGSAMAFSLVGLAGWSGRPGTGLLALVFALSLVVAWQNAWRLRAGGDAFKRTEKDCPSVR